MRLLAVLLAIALVAVACSDSGGSTTSTAPSTTTTLPPAEVLDRGDRTDPFTPGQVARVDLPRAEPEVHEADIAAVVASDTALGLDVFNAVAANDNLMISPYSIATALSMVYPGAQERTAAEMVEVLAIEVPDDTLHAVRNYIDTALATTAPRSEGDTREPFTIRPANSAWGQGGYPFLEEYLAVLADSYGAGLRLLDFRHDPDGSRDIINGWVEDATEDRITDLLKDDDVHRGTRLVLVNAIWFNANWAVPFFEGNTAPGPFELLDGSEIEVPMMRSSLESVYASGRGFEAVRLPYAGDAAMVIVLPEKDSPAEFAKDLNPSDLEFDWESATVDLTLPSFEFEADVPLNEVLKGLGMPTAFVPPWDREPDEADFSGITGEQDLYISAVRHKTFIALDENGTEAAAATAVVAATPLSARAVPPPVTMTVDRPFLFWIEHSSTGEMLFLGQVINPG